MKMSEALKGGAAALALIATTACGATAARESAAAVQIELPAITVTDAELEGNPFRAAWLFELELLLGCSTKCYQLRYKNVK